ncbi:glycosyltransferase [Alicyclobacillus hesperidum]|uniref:glycosyltransferase n=1 Tax=Alicyclobacillus hesperidum TaxID=89784 RepID=UPI0012FDA776|nr:glycosyltransferase [Alicyclobacillus hesperidum]
MESVLKIVVSELLRNGYDVTSIFTQPSYVDTSWMSELGNVVYSERKAHGLGPRFEGENILVSSILDLQSVLRKLPKPDVIVAMTPSATAIARAAIGVFGSDAPLLISWVHFNLGALPDRTLIGYADAHLAISTGILNQIRQLDPAKPVKLTFNPVHTRNVQPIPRASEPTFVYVGRLDMAQKRFDVLLQALSRLRHYDWRLRVVGDVVLDSDDTKVTIETLVKELKLVDRIDWMGWQTSPWAVVESASALVLTSDWEGFPLVMVEALARGIPVISSNCPTGPADIVLPGVNGWLFEPGNVEQLSSILDGILNGSTELPEPGVCTSAVEKFDTSLVVREMAAAIEHYCMHL